MNDDDRAAAENIRHLEQGARLIRSLDDGLYADCSRAPFPGGVGAQLRHCIEFYECFMNGLAGGRVDYTRRRRDAELETDRALAGRKLDELIAALSGLEPGRDEEELRVLAEGSPETGAWTRSTVRRELEFLASHTIHHYALIVLLLRLHGVEVPSGLEGFGVAPSTLIHWRKTGPAAG
jgi:uncharacterized damage-inducible protein DinB